MTTPSKDLSGEKLLELAESLSAVQRSIILNATAASDFCLRISHGGTKYALIRKGIFRDTQGFGFRYGGIQELTEKGRKVRDILEVLKERK